MYDSIYIDVPGVADQVLGGSVAEGLVTKDNSNVLSITLGNQLGSPMALSLGISRKMWIFPYEQMVGN